MMTMTVASMILVALVVIIHILVWNELPDSISEMVYKLPKGGWQWAWTIWLWAVLVLLTPQLMTVLDDSYKVLGFLTICCLAFVGAMPLFERTDRKLHYMLAIVGGILSQVCVAIIDANWLCMWMLFIFLSGSGYIQPEGYLGKAMKGKNVFLAEITCMNSIYGAILFH